MLKLSQSEHDPDDSVLARDHAELGIFTFRPGEFLEFYYPEINQPKVAKAGTVIS